MIYRVLDRLIERYSEREHKLAAMRAREEYFDRAGNVFDDDAELFESRMAAFLEWHVLERPLANGSAAPIMLAIDEGGALPPEERRALAALATTHRSLFQLHAAEARVLDVEDVIGGARFSVQERRSTVGISAGDVFEARLIWDPESAMVIFGRTFLFHPPDARDAILGWVERAVTEGKPRSDILFHLSRHYIRWHRLGHTGAAKVYHDV